MNEDAMLLNGCDPARKRKVLGVSINFLKEAAKFVGVIVCVLVSLLVFYFTSEARQDAAISDNKSQAVKIEARQSSHIESSNRIFEKLDSTMNRQQTLMSDTRETLSGVSTHQKALTDNQARILSKLDAVGVEVRKRNGHNPE